MQLYRITERNFLELLNDIAKERDLFVPSSSDGGSGYTNWDHFQGSAVSFPVTRILTPPKVFFFPPKEQVSRFPDKDFQPERKKQAVFGLKSCDLVSLQVLDAIFLEEEITDPYYAIRRHDTLLISSDCYDVADTCFCNKIGGQPYPKGGFDLNISRLPRRDDLFVAVNDESKEAQDLYQRNSNLFQPVSEELLAERTSFRKSLTEELDRKNNFVDLSKRKPEIPYRDPIWTDLSEECVECGACNFSCPTCHCFQLYEKPENTSVNRRRVWDSCNLKGYSRVAGGANPLESLESRVRNRFYDKFERVYENYGFYGCTGCGRCTDSCMGDIDIRDVLKEIPSANTK